MRKTGTQKGNHLRAGGKAIYPLILFILLTAGAVLAIPHADITQAATGTIVRCSTTAGGEQVNGDSSGPCCSADARYVAFESDATNLVTGDTNGRTDVFRKDLQTGDIIRCSTSSMSQEGDNNSSNPEISADGRYVVFESTASNLVSGDTNSRTDVFRKDLQTGDIIRCSTDATGNEVSWGGSYPALNADGRYVAFQSYANNLVSGDTNSSVDVFRKDLQTGDIIRCSTDTAGQEGNSYSSRPALDADGRYVAFYSNATNLVTGDSNSSTDVFRKDLQTGDIVRCSTSSTGQQGNASSSHPFLSADGRYVAFTSTANNLVVGDVNAYTDIYRKDIDTGNIVICSSDKTGAVGVSSSDRAAMSSNGRYVVFRSNSKLVPRAYEIPYTQVYRKDLDTGGILCCSASDAGECSASYSYDPCISSDGTYVFFHSSSSNLVTGDTNADSDIFRKEPLYETPGISSLDPASSFPGAEVTIHGGEFGATQGSSYVTFDATQATEYVSWSDTQIVVECPLGLAGDISVRVTNSIGTSNAMIFAIQPPSIQNIEPNYGYIGAQVSVEGSYFGSTQGSSIVTFGSEEAAAYGSWSDTEILCTVPEGITESVYVTVTTPNGTSNGFPFSVSPHISHIPSPAQAGSEVSITGNTFGPSRGISQVFFGSTAASQYTSWSDTNITCVVPSGLFGCMDITVTTPGGTSNAVSFNIKPRLDSIVPAVAPIGYEITLTGSGFGPSRGSGYVSFGYIKTSEYTYWSNTQIRVKVPYGIRSNCYVKVTEDYGYDSNEVPFETIDYAVCLAEGYTGNNFQQYLCIGNPNDYAAQVEIYYLFPDNTYLDDKLSVPARSRQTIDVNDYINPYFDAGSEVSTIVFSDLEVVVERPIYFNYQGRWTGGHDVVATPYVSKIWCFAEGYTGPGFEEYICVFNPNPEPANLIFHFLTQEEGEVERPGTVPAATRRTFKVNELLGADYQCSLVLESDQLLVAERSIYFDYTGLGNHHWEGGHCVMGQPWLAREYYFAEGTTRSGFEEWLTILNPYDEPITVIATYQLGEGQGTPVMKSYVIPPLHRYTVNVADEVGGEKDVSVKLASEYLFLAERPMYFRYTGYGASWEGGHCVMGASELSSDWFFAEGCTGGGFQEWLCLQNPGDEEAVVDVTYYGKSGVVAIKQVTVPAKSRKTLRVNDEAGEGLELSCQLRVTSGPPIMVERPIYFSFRGWDDGHDVIGYCPLTFGSSSSLRSAGMEEGTLLRDHAWEPGEKKPRD